jgi:hypothetical protein
MKSKVDELSEGIIVQRTYCRSGRNVCMQRTILFLGWTDNTSILGWNVAVLNCRMGQNVTRANRAGQIVA